MPIRTDYVDKFKGAIKDAPMFTHEHGRKRRYELTDAAKAVGEVEEFQGHHLSVPGPGKEIRWNGACRFLPMPWAETLRETFVGLRDARAYCLSCGQALQPEIEILPHLPGTKRHYIQLESVSAIYALARASDHDREYLNHQIVVLDHLTGDVIARNGFQPFSTSWA